MRKIIAIILTVITLLTVVCPSACAVDLNAVFAEANGYETDAEEPGQPEVPETPEEPDEPQGEQYVAKMYICVRLVVTGHAWIYIENLTDDTLRIGCYDCPKDEGVSLATYGFQRLDGFGTYYNVEAYMGHKKSLKRTKSNSMMLTQEQLDKVNEKILKSNEWSPFTNCCFFACKVWNCVAKEEDRRVAYGLFPFVTAISISSNGNEGVPDMYVPEREQVFRQKGKKEKAKLKVISKISLILGVG